MAAQPVAAASPPQISATWVTDVTSTSANLHATINPEGSSSSYRFEYLTEAAYLANLAASPPREAFSGAARAPASGSAPLGSGSAAIPVIQHVNGLAPETAYLYRAVSTNASGTAAGTARVLATEPPTNVVVPFDGRAWELVSPVDKAGGAVGQPEELFGGGDFQAASAGGAVTYGSTTAFADPLAAPPVSQYLAVRGTAGWTSSDLSPVSEAGGYGDVPDGTPFRVFADDLSRAVMLNASRCAAAGTCPLSYSLWSTPGALQALPGAAGLRFAGATPDLRHLFFTAATGLYEWSGAALEQVSGSPGAALAAPIGAVSENGQRIYFTVGEDGPLYLGQPGGPSVPLPETSGGGAFQVASDDGSVAFYLVGSTLYRYLAAAGTAEPLAGEVSGVLGSSAGGDVVYFQDASGIERWKGGAITTVLPGAGAALFSDYPPATGASRVSADGAHFAFLSDAEVPPFDNLDAATETPDTELYLYGPPPGGGAPRLLCVSCNPTGERPIGPASIPGAEVNGSTVAYRPRVLSASGNRIFFDTADRLVSADTNTQPDVYEWEAAGEGNCGRSPGCVGLVSGGRLAGADFVDASADGADVFFTTEDSLVAADPGSIDLYDYRTGGGFAEPAKPVPCVGDACQRLPTAPEDPTPATLAAHSGNPPAQYLHPQEHHRRHHHRKHRHRRHRHHGGRR